MESSVSAGKKQEMRSETTISLRLCALSADRQALREKIRRGGPAILWDRFVNEICLQFWGDSARFGFHPFTSIHFGCRPLFGSRLLGEVVS